MPTQRIIMTKLVSKILFISFSTFVVADVHAERPYNLDIGYSKIYYKQNNGLTFEPDHIRFSVSQDNFEAIASVSVDSKTKNFNGQDQKFNVPYILGFFYKPEFVVGYGINIYGKLGLTRSSNESKTVSAPYQTITSTANGLAYGVGVNFLSTQWTKLNLEYTSFYNRNGISVQGLSISNSIQFSY
jgi:hypothetical protein